MRILSVAEIPTDWKNTVTQHGLARYEVFSDDIQANIAVQGQSVQKVISILSGKGNSEFPYSDLHTTTPKGNSLEFLNKRNHMGVLVQDEDTGKVQFVHGILSMNTLPDYSGYDLPGITL